ncbi:MAG: substrate-binding domain-containing protein [Faecalicatena sp.]|uniref:substrate-binding domain-containing protein n=1 Tax=Faecalicatena sp. TaxID=2005360 RepID=UPI00258C9F1B|nr:substrate-binding domain-containing protein [Faecalicatena sp.]MCI6464696.1 substrate-binding domain-containing protein [Faecalicatena sp.]MDY5618274.1 substrate-binding domain-containing protein [Lachnospiraceae bacterium]
MKKRLLSLLLCAAMVMTMLAGCGGSKDSAKGGDDTKKTDDQSKDSGSKDQKVYKIGVSTQAWKYEFIKNMVNALNKLDDDMDNVELVMVDSEDSVEKQLSDVDTMIAQGVDGILLNCLSFEGSSSAVEACKNAGIPLVEFISYTENEDYATFVGTDVKSSGIMAMDLIADSIDKKGKLFEIQGVIGHTAQINRGAGIAEELKKYPDIELVESQSGEFSKDKAMAVTEAWLAKYPAGEIDAIVAHNDQMALGALNACQAANRTEIKIVGIDGDAESLQAVIDGKMAATVVDYCEEECRLAVEEMVSVLDGNEPKKEILADYVPVSTKEEAEKFLDMRSGN